MQLDVFGVPSSAEGSAEACPWRWPGQYEDAGTGLFYNRWRYHDPHTGRFVQQDPLGLLGGARAFAYAASPTLQTDPSGLLIQYGDLDAQGRPTGAFVDLTARDLRPIGTSRPTLDPPGWQSGRPATLSPHRRHPGWQRFGYAQSDDPYRRYQ